MKARAPLRTLDDLCLLVGGGTPPKSNGAYYGGDIPWATVRDMQRDELEQTEFRITAAGLRASTSNMIPANNVVVATRVGLGKVCMNSHAIAINQDLRGIIPKNPKELSSRYLFWWFKNVAPLIEQEGTGATVKGVKLGFIKSLRVPVPTLPEQQRIVSILDKALENIAVTKANTEKNISAAFDLFQSFLGQLLSAAGPDWESTTLGTICDLYQGLAINAKTKHLLVKHSNMPLLRIKDLRNGTTEQFVAGKYPKGSAVSPEDLIYTRTGQVGLVFSGRSGVLHNNCFKVVPKGTVFRDFLYWFLQNETFRARIIFLASKTAQPDISHTLFKQQPISLPPLKVQKEIARRIEELWSATEALQANYKRKLLLLDELKRSLLHVAFNGDL